VLVIEDDDETAAEIVTALGARDYVLVRAADGIEGLERARAGNWDVLVADRLLLGLDGLAVVETLRGEGIKTPALVLSGVIEDRSPYDGASGFRNRSEFCGGARMRARRHHAPPGQQLCPRPRRRARIGGAAGRRAAGVNGGWAGTHGQGGGDGIGVAGPAPPQRDPSLLVAHISERCVDLSAHTAPIRQTCRSDRDASV
jgi:CheY-like chemotaxis protein